MYIYNYRWWKIASLLLPWHPCKTGKFPLAHLPYQPNTFLIFSSFSAAIQLPLLFSSLRFHAPHIAAIFGTVSAFANTTIATTACKFPAIWYLACRLSSLPFFPTVLSPLILLLSEIEIFSAAPNRSLDNCVIVTMMNKTVVAKDT